MRFIFLVILIFFIGCGKSRYVYWDDFSVKKYKTLSKSIGIKLQIPEYLWAGNFVGVKNNKLTILDYKINGISEDFFEEKLVDALQRSFSDDKIKSYPFSFYEKPKNVVFIKIKDYYVDFDKYVVVLKFNIFNKDYVVKEKFKKIYYKALKIVYNKFINRVAEIIQKEVK